MLMKASFLRPSSKPVNRSTATNSVLINQLATPGLSSLLAGRYLAGAGPVLLALAGFGLIIGWFVSLMLQMYNEDQGNPQPRSVAWLGEAGAVIFFVAWLWA